MGKVNGDSPAGSREVAGGTKASSTTLAAAVIAACAASVTLQVLVRRFANVALDVHLGNDEDAKAARKREPLCRTEDSVSFVDL